MGSPNGLEPNLLETSDGTMVDVVATVLCVHPGCTVAETLVGKQIFRTDAKIVTGSFKNHLVPIAETNEQWASVVDANKTDEHCWTQTFFGGSVSVCSGNMFWNWGGRQRLSGMWCSHCGP